MSSNHTSSFGNNSSRNVFNKYNFAQSSYKDIFCYFEKLCVSFAGNGKHMNTLLQHVTQYLANCPNAFNAVLPYNEETIVAKITKHIKDFESGSGSGEGKNKEKLFLKLHEQIMATEVNPHKRCALLTLLYNLASSNCDTGNGLISKNSIATNTIPSIPFHTTSSSGIGLSSVQQSGDYFRANLLQLGQSNACSTNLNQLNHVSGRGEIKMVTPMSSTITSKNITPCTTDNEIPHIRTTADYSKSLELQNNDIVQNIIYAFTGIEGKYLKKDVISGKFKIDAKNKSINEVQAGMLLRLSELGYYHDKLQAYTDPKRGLCPMGLMGQGFLSALKNELTRYYGMVAMLQEQLNKQREFMSPYGLTQKNANVKLYSSLQQQQQLTLLKILVWSVEPLQRLQWLVTIAEACQETKGGALASTVHSFLSNGNPIVRNIAKELLVAICGPLYQMLRRWLLEGEILDAHGEFFIECLNEVGPDRLWHEKYRVRTAMLPNFISTDMANKILVTGKSINFLCEICQDKQPVKGHDELHQCTEENAEYIFAIVADTKLHSTIDAIYLNTSKRVLDVVVGSHKLLEHLQAMRRYLLLGQGDFIGILMENLKTELDKPAKELYTYDLSSIMDNAIRTTNAQYDDPEILNHLDVRLMAPCDGDIGWDILSLQYTVRGPLATMLEPSMGIYQLLFKPLWRMKHMEFVLSSKIWKDQKCNAKLLLPMQPEINRVLYRLHHFTSEMIHFIHQMQYYILFEVIECSWVELQEQVQNAKALDDILNAHDNFLETIKCGAFLDANSSELCQNMESVYEGIIRLELWQDKFYALCLQELQARKQFESDILQSEKRGEFGVNAEKKFERDQEHKIFEQLLNSQHKSLENIGADYEKAVRCFLLSLNSNNDHNLQLFGIRLDFNEYYKKRDQRLGVPLTFEHMRMSNVFYNTNKSLLGSRYSTIN